MAGRLAAFFRARGVEDPEAATSEVLLRVFRSIERFEGGEREFESWVFTIARRLAIDEHRRTTRRPRSTEAPVPDGVAPDDPATDALDRLHGGEVRAVLDGLTDEQRDVVLLRVVADLPAEQVGEIIGKAPDAVRALQHRALARLRRDLSQPVTP
ncbi:MAG: sigma-70 family RNA polymerase sigma factor [Acidimicrobiia bacterium]|nr:sigma-70 family RNA polymerase sigma factor [Acidimicrobiia bacterium]